ncbi:hypothetical protein RYX36_009473 [Vicia faba]
MYAEIDPKFVRNYNEELNKTWTVMNNQCVHQEMIFNKVRNHPMKLQVHTAIRLKNYGYEGLVLCRDNDMSKTMKLFNVDDPYNT